MLLHPASLLALLTALLPAPAHCRLPNYTSADLTGLLEARLQAKMALTESPAVIAVRRQLQQKKQRSWMAHVTAPAIIPKDLGIQSSEPTKKETKAKSKTKATPKPKKPSTKPKVQPKKKKEGRLLPWKALVEKRVSGRFLDTEDYDHDQSEHPWPPRPHPVDGAEELGNKFEGDIVLFPDQAEEIREEALHADASRRKRKFIAPNNRRWDARQPILYSFDGSHTARERKIIELALEHWQNITCLDFQYTPTKPVGNRIVFTDIDGCASNVGRHPLGEPQYVSIAPECLRLGVIAHEVAHALGFWHEQSRPDRDEYVNVLWDNIDRNSKGQFLKEQKADVDNGGVPYDYGSIMHYRSKAFASFDDLFTIHTAVRDYQKTIGQRDQLSFNDIRLMNEIYCRERCPSELACQRGGYTDPRKCDRCRCPDGFTGTLCDKVMSGYRANCGGPVQLGRGWISISSPNYPDHFTEGQECSWLLQAPLGQHVQLQFIGTLDLYCKAQHSLCMDYVEIRNTTDFANTGMRYCCYSAPLGSVFSATEDMLVLFRSFYRQGRGFKARARAVEAAGWWAKWGDWSTCSGSCGACGVQRRKRQCPSGSVCRGKAEESRRCNDSPCDVCPQTRYVSSPCGGFLGLLRGVRCKVERTVYVPCPSACCTGFKLVGGRCVPS